RTDYPDAREEYVRAAALFRQADGDLSQDAIVVELQRAAMEARSYETGTLPRAKSTLTEQEALIAKLPRPRPDVTVWDASARGMVALISNDAKAAAENFRNAVDQADRLPEFDRGDRLAFKQRLAFTYVRLGDGAQAEYLFRQLIPAYTAIAGANSPNVLRVRLNLAQAYMIEHKNVEAVREATAIYPEFVSRLGADHELTMQVLTTRAESEGSMGDWNDTVRDDMTVYKLAVQKHGPRSFYAVATLSDAATAQCRAGHFAEGAANAQRAYEASLKGFGPGSGLAGGTAFAEANCLIPLGKLQEATALLGQVNVPVVAQLAGDPELGAEVAFAKAQIAYRGGNYGAAKSQLEQVAPAFARSDIEPYEKQQFDSLQASLDKSPAGK
ncbi:MAG TPA: tetratricopeptide repeat protein, partial [Terracidiphilus sp.]